MKYLLIRLYIKYIVDLAGAENRIDSLYHDATRRKETQSINTSLMALKDCIRARSCGKDSSHIYRQSKLTLVLKESFSKTSQTVIMVTVSPASEDTEQTLNSLRHASMMDDKATSDGVVNTEEIGSVNVSAIARKNKPRDVCKSNNFDTDILDGDSDLIKENKINLADLEKQMIVPGISSLTKGGLKKRIALVKSVIIKELRKNNLNKEEDIVKSDSIFKIE
jgi:hypothetical protein